VKETPEAPAAAARAFIFLVVGTGWMMLTGASGG